MRILQLSEKMCLVIPCFFLQKTSCKNILVLIQEHLISFSLEAAIFFKTFLTLEMISAKFCLGEIKVRAFLVSGVLCTFFERV
jgi:hypothetical protein